MDEAERIAREQVVALVDAVRGCTCEHWPDPDEHRSWYDWGSERVAQALRDYRAEAEAENARLKVAHVEDGQAHNLMLERAEAAEAQVRELRDGISKIGAFAVGNGDVCELIASRCRVLASTEPRKG